MEIVTCHFKEDLSWLHDSPYPVHVVGKEGGDPIPDREKFASVEIIPNFAREASSYLWYIIKNYENLPERIAFIHGHENSPHQRIPIFDSIEKYGHHHSFVDLNRFMNEYMILIPKSPFCLVWDEIMKSYFGPIPKVINFRGMAQFVIHKDSVLYRPKWLYEKLYERSFSTSANNQSLFNWIGYFFEVFWHVIFGLESPLEDKPRINILESDRTIYLEVGSNSNSTKDFVPDDYIDVFMDSELKIYKGPWEFIKKLSEV